MSGPTRIRVEKRDSRFSAAHFLADMGKCERLHGHNYFVTLEAEGEPDGRGVVIDFNILDPAIASACQQLDHKVLVARDNPKIRITQSGAGLEILFKEKRYLLPAEDCLILPMASTSVESLAGYLLERIAGEIASHGAKLGWIEVGVSEGGTQTAFCRKVY